MAAPIVTPWQNIPEMTFQQYERYLPSAFDGELSMLEKLNKLLKYMNDIGVLVNGIGTQWNEITDWVMNEGLTDAVNAKLEEWLNDGTLKALLDTITSNTEALDAFKAELAESLTTKTIYLNGNAKSKINDLVSDGRQELELYAAGDAYSDGSKGAGIHLYGNEDVQHAGNIAFLTGQNDQGDARMIISGGSNNPTSDGYRTNTDTRVTIGNGIWDFVDEKQDTALLNLKNPSGRPAICFIDTASDEGELSVPPGERLSMGHWDGSLSQFTERVAIDGSGRFIVKSGSTNGDSAKMVDGLHTPFIQEFGDSQSKSSQLQANYSSDGASSANLYLAKSPSNIIGSNAATRVSDTLGEVDFAGNDGTGFFVGASVSASVQTSDWTPTSKPTRLQLKTTAEGSTSPQTRLTVNATGSISAGSDNTQSFGTSSFRWSSIYAGTGTINTSDRNEKQQIQDITDTILDAWAEVNYCMFKFNDAVEAKGDEARLHFGIIAQSVDEAFTRHGLNAFDYGILCKDELETGGERWGVRMTECLALESALLRREINRLKGK